MLNLNRFISLETERLILRKIESRDIRALFAYWSDDRVTEHMNIDSFSSLWQARSMVKLLNGLVRREEGLRWAIVSKEDNKLLGTCGYHNVKKEHRRAEVGYELGIEHWGKGIMQEAIQAVLKHCFIKGDFNRIEALVNPDNQRSLNTLKKVGFSVEGELRDYEIAKGQSQNYIILSLLKRDWAAQVNMFLK